MGRHHDDARRSRASELRLQMARAFDRSEGAGRSRRMVRHRPGQSRRLQGQRSAHRRRAAKPTASATSTRSISGGRRWRSATTQGGACVPYYAGCRTTSPSSGGSLKRPEATRSMHGAGSPPLRRGRAAEFISMVAAVSFQNVSRHFGSVRAVDDVSLDDRRRRVLRHARAVRLGQDDVPPADRRLRPADQRPHRDFWRDGRGRAALPAEREHGVPGLRALPAHAASSTMSPTG